MIHGQTDRIAYGMGAFASRVTVMTGEATRIAATKLRDKAIAAAAALLQSAPDALDVVDGNVVRKNAPQGPSVTLGEVARALAPGAKLLGDSDARPFRRRLVRIASHDLSRMAFMSRSCASIATAAQPWSSAILSLTISAKPSIRC